MHHGKWQILTQPWVTHRITGRGQVQRTKFTDLMAKFTDLTAFCKDQLHWTCNLFGNESSVSCNQQWASRGTWVFQEHQAAVCTVGIALYRGQASLGTSRRLGSHPLRSWEHMTEGRCLKCMEMIPTEVPATSSRQQGKSEHPNCRANRSFPLFSSLSAPSPPSSTCLPSSPSSCTHLPAPSPELSLHLGSRNQGLTVGFYTLPFLVPREQSEHAYYTFVETHKTYNTKSEPDVNHGLWVTVTCQCGSVDCSKRSPRGTNIDSGGHCVCVRWAVLCTFCSILF